MKTNQNPNCQNNQQKKGQRKVAQNRCRKIPLENRHTYEREKRLNCYSRSVNKRRAVPFMVITDACLQCMHACTVDTLTAALQHKGLKYSLTSLSPLFFVGVLLAR
jgi:hypothetical protein